MLREGKDLNAEIQRLKEFRNPRYFGCCAVVCLQLICCEFYCSSHKLIWPLFFGECDNNWDTLSRKISLQHRFQGYCKKIFRWKIVQSRRYWQPFEGNCWGNLNLRTDWLLLASCIHAWQLTDSDGHLINFNCVNLEPSVLWQCWLGGRKGIRPVKNMGGDGGGEHWLVWMEWHPAGWSVYLPLLIFPCTMKSRSSLLALAYPGGPGKRP